LDLRVEADRSTKQAGVMHLRNGVVGIAMAMVIACMSPSSLYAIPCTSSGPACGGTCEPHTGTCIVAYVTPSGCLCQVQPLPMLNPTVTLLLTLGLAIVGMRCFRESRRSPR
jgi:hypothetical protein